MMFAFVVALGCDIFDSASYALFARNGRYMTAQGTAKIDELEFFPCNCPVCLSKTPQKVRGMLLMERERFLAAHNLHACFSELQTIKQAILDGRLWELVEARSHNHPALQSAFQELLRYKDRLEPETPVRKRKGPFVLSEESLLRPEVTRYHARLIQRYVAPTTATALVLLPEEYARPFREQPDNQPLEKLARQKHVHVCAYSLTYAIVPYELLDVYPLSQTESSLPLTPGTVTYAAIRIAEYIRKSRYRRAFVIGYAAWHKQLATLLTKRLRKPRIRFVEEHELTKEAVQRLLRQLK
jgi:7-cyano-7-deazaguanine tRNA-ribosyltransferase